MGPTRTPIYRPISPLNQEADAAARNALDNYLKWRLPAKKPQGKPRLVCGLDLGSKRDHSALCLIESEYRINEQTAEEEQHFICRYFRRLPLGLGYPEIVECIAKLDLQLSVKYEREAIFVVDSTGVGFAVLNYLRKEVGEDKIKGVSITGGREASYKPKPNEHYVPKQQLVAQLQVLLQTGRLHLPNTRDSKAMHEELLQYSLKMRGSGSPELGALKSGQHDDLVTSCLLAVHWLTRRRTTPRVKWF